MRHVAMQFPCLTSIGRLMPGAIVELPDHEADLLIRQGMAIEHRMVVAEAIAGAQPAPAAFPHSDHADYAAKGAVRPAGGGAVSSADLAPAAERGPARGRPRGRRSGSAR